MAIITGEIEAKTGKGKYGTYGILVNGKWYNSKYEARCEKGDTVEFDDGGKNYYNKLKVVGGSGGSSSPSPGRSATPGFPVALDTKDRAIVRQNSLGHATSLVSNMIEAGALKFPKWEDREAATEAYAVLCVDVARIFEAYSSGDADAAAATEMAEE